VSKSVKFVVLPLSEGFVHGNFCLDLGAVNNLLRCKVRNFRDLSSKSIELSNHATFIFAIFQVFF